MDWAYLGEANGSADNEKGTQEEVESLSKLRSAREEGENGDPSEKQGGVRPSSINIDEKPPRKKDNDIMTTPKADNKQKNTDEKKSQVEKDEDIDPRDNTSEESGGKVDLAAEAKKPFDSMGGVPIFDDNRGTFSEGYNSITERAANQYNQLIIGN